MKKIFTTLFFGLMATGAVAQWTPTSMQGEKLRPTAKTARYYSLDIKKMHSLLANAEETGKNVKSVEIKMPTLDGKIERFAVYSAPVVVKSLADRYQLGSYVGVGIDNPNSFVRFSIAPNDFQAMIMRNGVYEFIEPENNAKTVYGVHPKTNKSDLDRAFLCTTTESSAKKNQIENLYQSGKSFDKNAFNFNKSSDRKFRTLRLAISVNAEYTLYFGGVSQALAAINATLTRVNGVFEKDFALRLILQDFPQLIYKDPATDPYTNLDSWNLQLQQTLTNNIGSSAYDIGHMFGASGGGGNAGCIGCVCVNPTSSADQAKGSGISSPADGIPQGDSFDIDFVAHEMGHQLGANHTFSYEVEGSGQNVEPGSGSTIMGYAGISGSQSDVQNNSDAYFHINSINQVYNNLIAKSCDIEIPISNTPPVVTPMPTYNIPKSTAFFLTAQATDLENNPLTYTWEEVDDASVPINKATLGNTVTGASFRSLPPTVSPTRYFPKLQTVLAGIVSNPDGWESVSKVSRDSNFTVTVRDNNPDATQQQTQSATQKIIVGNNGPFEITSNKAYNNFAGPLNWDVASTNAAPYNVANVKIDYTTNNGTTWTVLSTSTPNDGSESYSFSSFSTGTQLKVRISAIDNVFYTIKELTAGPIAACDGTAPTGFSVTDVYTNSAKIVWDAVSSATYVVRYKKKSESTYTQVSVNENHYTITNLLENTAYDVQVATVCSGTVGSFASLSFTTTTVQYCSLVSNNSDDEFISRVQITAEKADGVISNSGASNYTDYSGDPSRLVKLRANTTNNTISVTKAWTADQYDDGVSVWIDFNRNGEYETSEKIMATPPNINTPVTATFAVPADAYVGDKTLGMRVVLSYDSTPMETCGVISYGEVEDYAVQISSLLAVGNTPSADEVTIYPNPATDVLNITKVNDKAEYSIYNMAGQIVTKGKVTSKQVNISNLEKGVYIFAVDYNNDTIKLKFIKK